MHFFDNHDQNAQDSKEKREVYKEQEKKEGMMGGREGGFYLFLLVYTYM